MTKRFKMLLLLPCCFLFISCTKSSTVNTTVYEWTALEDPIDHMELQYAEQFTVDYYPDAYALITIGNTDRYLLVPEGKETPAGMENEMTIIQQPVSNIYLAASSAMDLFDGLDALGCVRMTSTTKENWSLPHVQQALADEELIYIGKYSSPDYEAILSEGCNLTIESTMIYHNPEIKEQLERLGIPVMVERSSYETHPMGRMEWIKLYGLILGKEEEAESLFQEKSAQLDKTLTSDSTNKTVAFFYISSNGYVNVRKPGDYISKMIALAGGTYIFSSDDLNVEENALSTMNIQMETFYTMAKEADCLIYNSTVDGELNTLDQLLQKSELLADFKAVKEGNVWCTEKNMFQQTTGAADMIADLHTIISGEATGRQLDFLHRLS